MADCQRCEAGDKEHHHCMQCREPLEADAKAKTHQGECRRAYERIRRKSKSVRVWVEPVDGSGPRRQVWVPKSVLKLSDRPLSGDSGAIGAKLGADTGKPLRGNTAIA